jgi:hypothetical protein
MQLSTDKAALLSYLLEREGYELSPAIKPRRDGREPPLSFAQQRLWFLQQLEPDSPAYNLPRAFRVGGRLNIPVLERTLGEIVRRHEVLRTTFGTSGDRQVQVIHPARELSVPVIDLGGLPEAEREARVRALADEEARRPFDLARGPLLRIVLLRLADDDHVALFTLHHIVSDGWSTGVLVNEVMTLYAAYSAGRPSPLAELPIQYADYAGWQRDWLRGEQLERQVAYWRERLRDAPATLSLPTDRPRPAARRYRGAIQGVRLPAELSDGLKKLSRDEGATLFMTLFAAFNVLLYCYARQEDIVVGTPVAGRNRVEVEPLIGFFVNTLALRTDLSGDPAFRELLRRVKEDSLGAFAHQDVPFEKLVEELQPERSLSHTPLFQVAFTLQKRPRESFQLPGLTLSPLGNERGTTQYDLALNMVDADGGDLTGSLEYDTDLFDAATVTRLIERFETVLREAVARPAARLGEFAEKLGAADRERERAGEKRYEEFYLREVGRVKRRGIRAGRTDTQT